MIHLVIAIALIYLTFLLGYALGRHDIIKDIKRMTKELKEKGEINDNVS